MRIFVGGFELDGHLGANLIDSGSFASTPRRTVSMRSPSGEVDVCGDVGHFLGPAAEGAVLHAKVWMRPSPLASIHSISVACRTGK